MRFLFSAAFLLFTGFVFSQTKGSYKDYFMEGSYLYLENNPEKATENFEKAYKIDSSSANINYLLGLCYVQSALQKSKAEYYLAKAVKNVSQKYRIDEPLEKASAPLAHFFYGQALHINYKFDEAIAQYEIFRKMVNPKDKEYIQMINRNVEIANFAKEMVAKPLNVQITNLGDSVNSEWPDFSPVLSADERTLIYTTRRPNSTGGLKTEDGQYFEDIVVSYKDDNEKWSKPVALSYNVNTIAHEASINLTPDGQTLIVYKSDPNSKNPDGDGNIYYTTFDGKDWSNLKEFGSNVNTEYQESHACLSADGNVLFFASERTGGYGGKDIYRCIKLPNGKWSKALNMGSTINTEYDEDGSFIHPDGQTFFFASNGHKSMGGYDIMFASLNEDNKFANVTNIGYPINTTDDDVFYVMSPDGKRGYFSSAKVGGYGEKDIYKITIAEAKESFLALFKGQLIPAEGEKLPDNITIVVTDKISNEIIGTYRPRITNGTFSTILPPGKEYNFSYQTDDGEEFYNEDVFVNNEQAYQEIKREVNLEPVKLGKVRVRQKTIILNTVVLNNAKQKKAIPGAKITMEEVGGDKKFFDADKNGKYEGIALQADKKYMVYAEDGGKKSPVAEISTMGVKSAKIINQILYLEGKSVISTKEILLDVVVKAFKTKKPVPNTTIVLTDADGTKTEVVTDSKGVIKGIELFPDTKYELYGIKDGHASEKEIFTTGSIAEAKRISKTLYITYDESAVVGINGNTFGNEECGELGTYRKYFAYNKRDVEADVACWDRFINQIVEVAQKAPASSGKKKKKKRAGVTIIIEGSASRVPRRGKGGNKGLAAMRANNLEKKLRAALKEKGVNMAKIRFVKSSAVNGPKYKGDWNLGRKKYEKYQYVKARVK
ncbi:MAG: PD40 domain-containing protein [Bacteroidia bacterium]|nr:PD40 domain-containing protein [Bacteroidia bacterium]